MRKSKYEENELEFLIQKATDIVLVYPKNCNFINDLRRKYVKKLKKHGWDIDKTVFIEIPYVMTFSYRLLPALVATFIMDVVPQKSYFKCLVLTRNYLPNSHFIEIEDTIAHEKLHLEEEEPKFLQGTINAGDPTLKKDIRVDKEISSMIEQKYGGKLVQKIKERSIKFAYQVQVREKTIVSGFLEYWLWRYLNENFEKYHELTYLASQPMLNALDEINQKTEQKIKQSYIRMFNYGIA